MMMMIEQYLCNQDVQVAHKSERNLSSSSRHAYTFHIIGQNGRHDDDGDGGDYDGLWW